MATKGRTFSVNTGEVDKIIEHWKDELKDIDRDLLRKMNASINLVYALARARRPKIAQVGRKKGYRVSDPAAEYGVPVKTGLLRSAIKKEAEIGIGKVIGRVWVDEGVAHYAPHVEFGTSKMQKRPFLRPALLANWQRIKRIFTQMRSK